MPSRKAERLTGVGEGDKVNHIKENHIKEE